MKNIGHSRGEGIEVLTLARATRERLDIETTEELADAFEALASDDAAAAVVLTGEGKAFCAGLDLKAIPNYSQPELRRLLDAINRMATAVYGCPLPVIRRDQRARDRWWIRACDVLRLENCCRRTDAGWVDPGPRRRSLSGRGARSDPQRASSESRARAGTVLARI